MSSYYDASKDKAALELALDVFATVEEKCRDDVAYLEAFSKDWNLIPNDALSETVLWLTKQ